MKKDNLTPKCVFEQFAKINTIPRPSKHEERMIAFLKEFGKSHGLETKVDDTGNVLICKPATPGYEDRAKVVLQSHMDMVCEKLVDVDIDFNDVVSILPDGVSETGAPKFGCYENYNWSITPSCLQQRVAGAKKEIIELAVISIDLDLQDAIIEFNRRNTEYRIDYTEYRTVDDPTGLTAARIDC